MNSVNSESKEKAIAVIDSCTSCDHFDNAVQYIELYLKASDDQDGYSELMELLKTKMEDMNCYKPS